MGFLTDEVLSSDSSTAEFICKICCMLSENPSFTSCNHVFCSSCLDEWFAHKRSCPACNASLASTDVCDLKIGNPLAWRILGRIQLKCPLHKQGCQWEGDYSEVQGHLTSDESHASSPSKPRSEANQQAQAEVLKQQGNSRFEARAWKDAIKLYTKAIDMYSQEASYYGNRAAAYLMLKEYGQCVEDCETAIRLRPDFTKAHVRLAKAWCEMGHFEKALGHIQRAYEAHPCDPLKKEQDQCVLLVQWLSEGKAALQAGDPALACQFFFNMLNHTEAVSAQLWLARAELGLGKVDQVLRRTRDLIKGDRNNTQALAVRGRALYLTGDYDQAVKHLNEALRLDPDEKEAQQPLKRIKRVRDTAAAAKDAAFKREFSNALHLYTEAIDEADAPRHAPLMAQLHAERAKSALRLKQYDACLKDCAVAVYAMDDHIDAWLVKAQALHALGRHHEALKDMSDLYQLYQSDERVKGAYKKAEFEVRREKRPDYYTLLEVSTIATEGEIKFAYKQKALEYHPDKQVDASEEDKKVAEAKFKQLQDVLEILTDPMKRKLYDEGYDKAAIEERVKAANKAAREGHHHRH